jgi:hypothetical protein
MNKVLCALHQIDPVTVGVQSSDRCPILNGLLLR